MMMCLNRKLHLAHSRVAAGNYALSGARWAAVGPGRPTAIALPQPRACSASHPPL